VTEIASSAILRGLFSQQVHEVSVGAWGGDLPRG